MPKPRKTVGNVLVGEAYFFIGPENQPRPTDDTDFGMDWGTPWYHPGLSESGLTWNIDRKEKKHRVSEISNPVVITVDETTMRVDFTFAEATLENIMYASGGGTITKTAASQTSIAKEELRLSESLTVVSVGFDGKNPKGFWRRIVIPRVVSVGKIKAVYDRSKQKQMYAAQFESICSIEDCYIGDKVGNKLVATTP